MCSALYARSNAAMSFGIGYITISFATAMDCLPGVSCATGAAMIMCVNLTGSRMPRLKVAVSNSAGGPAVQIRRPATLHNAAGAAYNVRVRYRTSTMVKRFFRIILPMALAGVLGLQTAYADIYTWVDAAGSINISNLAPPDGVHVTRVMHASAPAGATGDEPARDTTRQAEMRALAERV